MAPLKAAHLSTPAAAGSLAGCADAKQAVICLFAEAHASKDTAPAAPGALPAVHDPTVPSGRTVTFQRDGNVRYMPTHKQASAADQILSTPIWRPDKPRTRPPSMRAAFWRPSDWEAYCAHWRDIKVDQQTAGAEGSPKVHPAPPVMHLDWHYAHSGVDTTSDSGVATTPAASVRTEGGRGCRGALSRAWGFMKGLLPRAADIQSVPSEAYIESEAPAGDPLSAALDDGWMYGTLGRPRQPMAAIPNHPCARAPSPPR